MLAKRAGRTGQIVKTECPTGSGWIRKADRLRSSERRLPRITYLPVWAGDGFSTVVLNSYWHSSSRRGVTTRPSSTRPKTAPSANSCSPGAQTGISMKRAPAGWHLPRMRPGTRLQAAAEDEGCDADVVRLRSEALGHTVTLRRTEKPPAKLRVIPSCRSCR